jgi:hypothetical protein
MLSPLDEYYAQLDEPFKSCLSYLRKHILSVDNLISEAWKYGMPFFCIKGKMFCYLWIHKKYHKPYLGIVEGKKIADPDLIQEKRARMKILLLDPEKNLPIKKIDGILQKALALYK